MSTDIHPWDGQLIQPWVRLFGRRWVLDMLTALSRGELRRSMPATLIPGVSEKMLTDTLRELIASVS